MSDVPSELSEIFHTRSLSISLVEIDDQKEIGNQSREQLHQDSVRISGDKVIDLQMFFPPGEERFNLPSQRINKGDLFSRQVLPISSDQIDFSTAFEADQKEWPGHLVKILSQ